MNQINLDKIPVAPEQCVTGFGTTLIVAPHADDESLGCGGMISLLRKYDQDVYILLLSDGTMSHPGSKEYPAEKLRELREHELIEASAALGVPVENIIFCRYPDRNVPCFGDDKFDSAVNNITKMVNLIRPQSIFVPWRRDPHPDHKAAFQLINSADTSIAKIYEYPIWLKELGEAGEQFRQTHHPGYISRGIISFLVGFVPYSGPAASVMIDNSNVNYWNIWTMMDELNK